MNIEDIDKWYRTEVISNPETYPNLFKIEIAKNRFKFIQRPTWR